MEKRNGGRAALWKRVWVDPVGSKLIAGAIGGMATLIWVGIQSLVQHIPLAASFHCFLSFLGAATPINNCLLLVAGIALIAWIVRAIGRRRRNGSSISTSHETAQPSLPDPEATVMPLSAAPGNLPLVRYGSQRGDMALTDAFQIVKGSPKIRLQNDGHYGQVVDLDINMTEDTWDCNVMLGREAKTIAIVARPENTFIFYVKVSVAARTENAYPVKWIALRSDYTMHSTEWNAGEKSHPARWKQDNGQWMIATYNIAELVDACYGEEGWKYHELVALRVRGRGLLANVTLS